MSRTLAALAVVAGALGGVAGLLAVHPFQRAGHLLDAAFGAPPPWTQVSNLYRDSRFQETSKGERPLSSFEALAAGRQPDRRVLYCFIGNSQMLTVSLADGEPAAASPERTYVDQIALALNNDSPAGAAVYRLAAPGLSYLEALWYVIFLAADQRVKPDAIFLQLNYQAFWNGGVRSGMLELLDYAPFRSAVERIANSSEAYAEAFREALRAYEDLRKNSGRTPAVEVGYGASFEAWTRDRLDALFPEFARRRQHKDAFLEMLYRGRIYFLRLKPSTARSITGVRLMRSRASIETIARLCNEHKIRLVLFHAPVNPQVTLYAKKEDRESYRAFAARMAQLPGVTVTDYEDAIPGARWGRWMNGPDPLHLSRAGHRDLAVKMQGWIARNQPVEHPDRPRTVAGGF